MKSRLWIIISFLAYVFLLIPPIQAEVKEMDENLPQPDDPVLFTVTEKNVTMDIVSLDLVTFPVSEWTGISTDQGTYDYFLVGLCFTAIDDGEWMVIPAYSSVGKFEIIARTYANGGMIPATAEKQGRICGQLGFDITGMKLDWSQPLSIGVSALFAPAREGSHCKDIMCRYESNAAAQAMKVSLSCDDNKDEEMFRSIITTLFCSFPVFEGIDRPGDEIIQAFWDNTEGVMAHITDLFYYLVREYLSRKKRPELTPEYINLVTDKYLFSITKMIEKQNSFEPAAVHRRRMLKEMNAFLNPEKIGETEISVKDVTAGVDSQRVLQYGTETSRRV